MLFVDRTDDWKAVPEVIGRGLGLVVGNLDDRPGIDLMVANDMTNNHFRSAIPVEGVGKVELQESAMVRGLGGDDRALSQGSMGIAVADLDRDGDIDFYVTNFEKEYNTLYDGRRGSVWQDRTERSNLSRPTLPLVGFGTEATDLDHAGNLEILVSNGHVDLFSRNDERSVYAQPMQVFRRQENGAYESVADRMSGSYVSQPHVGRALWTIDADRNGQQDFVITHQTEPTALLMNHSRVEGHWIELSLRGTQSNRDAIGATIRVTRNDSVATADEEAGRVWTAALIAGHGYLCSNEQCVHFGLGETKDLPADGEGTCDIHINWPSGLETKYTRVPLDRRWLLVEGRSQANEFE